MPKLNLQNSVAKYCVEVGNAGDNKSTYWHPWEILLEPELFSQFYLAFTQKFEDWIIQSDVICGIPRSGLPLSTLIHRRYNKPLLVIDFEHQNLGVDRSLLAVYRRPLLIDTVVNTGGTISDALSITEKYLSGPIYFAIGVLNDTLPLTETNPLRDTLLRMSKMDCLFRISELITI